MYSKRKGSKGAGDGHKGGSSSHADAQESDLESSLTPPPAATESDYQLFESDDYPTPHQYDRERRKHLHKKHPSAVPVPESDTTLDVWFDDSEEEERVDEDGESWSTEMPRVYAELQAISNKLKQESRILHDREVRLREREKMVAEQEEEAEKYIKQEVQRRLNTFQQKILGEIEKLDFQLKEKIKENKRLKENFDTLKEGNESLRKQLEDLQVAHNKLEKQAVGVQARLTNLQRKQEFTGRQKDTENLLLEAVPKNQKIKPGKPTQKSNLKAVPSTIYSVVSVLFEWVCNVQLRHSITEQPTQPLERLLATEMVQDKCVKLLPCLVEILRDLPGNEQKTSLPCLQFVYWSLLHLDNIQLQQKSSLSSTLRRLGEELYRPKMIRFVDGDQETCEGPSPPRQEKPKDDIFFKSPNLHVRFLSSLVILKTLNQVDLLAHVFDVMRTDLKTDAAKELFLHYQAIPVITHYLKPTHKTLLASSVDVFLQMSMESHLLAAFLESCGTEVWFRSVSSILRSPSLDDKLTEKLSIILQKLSKIKGNKKYFDAFGISKTVMELQRSCSNEQAFLALNLKSIIFNLNIGKPSALK